MAAARRRQGRFPIAHSGRKRASWRLFATSLSLVCSACTLTPHEIQTATAEQDQAVVFDIDGTLTTRIHAIRDARQGAVAAVQAYAEAGYLVVYLTARTPLFQFHIPGWLERHDFPAGPIHVTESREHRSDLAAFKQGVLEDYRAHGWTLVAAYGDTVTDFEAYAGAGLPRARVFALRREGETTCDPGAWTACFATWPEQMDVIGELIGAQP